MNITVVIYASILFFLSELILRITKHSEEKSVKKKDDKKSLTIFWFIIPVSLTIGFFAANYGEWTNVNNLLAILGMTLFTAGIIIRWMAIFQLDKDFTVDVAITKNHNLKVNGIYKKSRHPSYLGLLLICFGLSLAMNSIVSFIIISLPVYFAIIYRIKIEESILLKEFGEPYKKYMLNTHKLFIF